MKNPDKPPKVPKTDAADKAKGSGKSRVSIPDDCTTHDADNKPLCFKFQQGKCSFKGPAGKRVCQRISQVPTGRDAFA